MGMGMHDGCSQQENSFDVDKVAGEGVGRVDCIEVGDCSFDWWWEDGFVNCNLSKIDESRGDF